MQGWLGGMLTEHGMTRIAAEELTVPPGGDELFSLLELKRHHESGAWDVVVVDCAPTGETLRLLSFPDVARWWLGRVLGREAQLLGAARPIARTFLDLELPDERVWADVQRLMANLVAMNEILRDRERVSLRLVMTPDRMVVAEAMRTFTYLNLYGYLTDAVVVNRVFPDEVAGTYFGAWRELQHEQLALVDSAFAPIPVLRAPYFEQEVLGAAMLDRLGDALFAGARARGRAARLALAGARARRGRRRRAAARAALRLQGRHLAQEDRARAGRAGRRAQAHDPAAARDGRAPAVGRRLRRRRAGGALWLRRSPRTCARGWTPPTPPPTGWSPRPRRPRAPRPRACRRAGGRRRATPAGERRPAGDLQALAGVVELLRTAVPPELSRQLLEALRELLLAVRALIDFYLERLERRPAEEPEVQDIPID